MRNAVVIINPNSGKGQKNLKKQFEHIFNSYNYHVEFINTEYAGHAKRIIRELSNNIDLVVSIGGDGTFNEIVSGNFKREKQLVISHIPMGTTNDIGVMFGYGKNVINNLRMLLAGEIRKMDICTINNRPFIYVGGFGRFMNVPYETPRQKKKAWGYLAYISEMFKEFLKKNNRLYDIIYTIDGKEYRGLFSFGIISNANRIAGINNFYQDVKLDDGKFEVLFCNLTKKKDIVKSFYFLTMNNIESVPGFYFYRTDNLKMEFVRKLKKPWCIDGEKMRSKNKSYTFKVIKGVKIQMPKVKNENLFIKK